MAICWTPRRPASQITTAWWTRTRAQVHLFAVSGKKCDRVARGLMAIGVRPGDHVAIWATNRIEWVTAMFATAKIGAVMVTVNTNYKRFELEYLLRQSDAMTLILIQGFKDSDYVQHLREICPELAHSQPGRLYSRALPFLKNVIYLENEREPGMYNWDDLYALAENVDDAERQSIQDSLDIHDVVNMQYTSGTTGFPKGVMLSHHGVVNNGKSIGDGKRLTEIDRECIPVPLFHCFGCVLGVTACVTTARPWCWWNGSIRCWSYRRSRWSAARPSSACPPCIFPC